MPAKLSVPEIEIVLKLYKKGWTISQIAAEVRRDRGVVARYIKLYKQEEAIRLTPAAGLSTRQVDAMLRLVDIEPKLAAASDRGSDDIASVVKVLRPFLRADAEPLLTGRELKRLRSTTLAPDRLELSAEEIGALQELVPIVPMLQALAAQACGAECRNPKCRATFVHLGGEKVTCPYCGMLWKNQR